MPEMLHVMRLGLFFGHTQQLLGKHSDLCYLYSQENVGTWSGICKDPTGRMTIAPLAEGIQNSLMES